MENIENQHQINPNNPHWNFGIAFFLWMASVALIVLLPNFSLLFYLAKEGIQISDAEMIQNLIKTDPIAILYSIVAIIPAHLLTFILAWLVVTKMGKISFTEALGWKSGDFRVWDYFIYLGFFFVLAASLTYIVGEQDNELLQILRSSRTAVYVVAFMATFTAPIVEEVIYRGILYSAFQKNFGKFVGVAVVTFLFALVHVPQYYPSWVTIVMICLLSLALTLVRANTNNLLPCIILHTLINGIQSVLLILAPYLEEMSKSAETKPALFLHLLK
jgi:uncharacterized protein